MARTDQRAMPIALIVIAALLVIARIAVHLLSAPDSGSSSLVNWVPVEDAHREAASTNRPLLIDFTADWCAPCHLLDREVFQDPAMAKLINERFVPVRVLDRMQEEGKNTRAVEELQRRYTVSGFPTVVIASWTSQELARMEGFRGADSFRRMMESVP